MIPPLPNQIRFKQPGKPETDWISVVPTINDVLYPFIISQMALWDIIVLFFNSVKYKLYSWMWRQYPPIHYTLVFPTTFLKNKTVYISRSRNG